jgi:hypothetical protein
MRVSVRVCDAVNDDEASTCTSHFLFFCFFKKCFLNLIFFFFLSLLLPFHLRFKCLCFLLLGLGRSSCGARGSFGDDWLDGGRRTGRRCGHQTHLVLASDYQQHHDQHHLAFVIVSWFLLFISCFVFLVVIVFTASSFSSPPQEARVEPAPFRRRFEQFTPVGRRRARRASGLERRGWFFERTRA